MSVLSTRTGSTLKGASGFVGFGRDGAEDIKRHPWFEGINWEGETASTITTAPTSADRQTCTRRKRRISPTYRVTTTQGISTRTSPMR
jgi:hypothetical protein